MYKRAVPGVLEDPGDPLLYGFRRDFSLKGIVAIIPMVSAR